MFDNVFDSAMSAADDVILKTMGRDVWIEIAGRMVPVKGVFDVPAADVQLKKHAGHVQDVAPRLFVKSHDVEGVRKKAKVLIRDVGYWVVKAGPDDNGSCELVLARGEPAQTVAEIKQWS